MKQLNANQFPDVMKALGVRLDDLGTIMLDLDKINVTEMVTGGKADLYSSPDPERWWVAGAVAEEIPHVTLLHGLMQEGRKWKPLVDILLADWTPPLLEVEKVGAFQSPYPNEQYSCIVAHIKVTPELMDGHQRLQLLPHIDVFPEYLPHMTLAYVKPEAEEKWVKELTTFLSRSKFTVNKINYGGKPA